MHILLEAGWPVYPVLAFGILALVQAVRYARGTAAGVAVAGSLAALVFAGVLGTALGVQLAFGGIPTLPDPAAQHWIAFVGVKEAIYNLDVALAFALFASLIASFGRGRRTPTAANR
jgi:hypothetical protein